MEIKTKMLVGKMNGLKTTPSKLYGNLGYNFMVVESLQQYIQFHLNPEIR